MGVGTGVVAVGTVPDEVLLACGRPTAAPSDWWSPSLVDRPDHEVARLRTAAEAVLEDLGARAPDSGRLRGVLGGVADVVARARVLALLTTEQRGAGAVRRSIVAAPDRALLDLHGDGVHDLLLAPPPTACSLLAALLAGDEVPPPSPAVTALAGRTEVATVDAVLPAASRTATTRIVRTATDRGLDPVAHAVTVVHHPDGVVACWAQPDGGLLVQVLEHERDVADLAVWVLGGTTDEDGDRRTAGR